MNKDEFKKLVSRKRELETVIPKLEMELRHVSTKLISLRPEELKAIAEPWDGRATLEGRVRWSDRTKWEAILQTSEFDFVFVSVALLKSTNRIAASNLAQTFAKNQFPRSGFNYGATRISIHGHCEFIRNANLPELSETYERKRSEFLT
jgi:hypothetical protein